MVNMDRGRGTRPLAFLGARGSTECHASSLSDSVTWPLGIGA